VAWPRPCFSEIPVRVSQGLSIDPRTTSAIFSRTSGGCLFLKSPTKWFSMFLDCAPINILLCCQFFTCPVTKLRTASARIGNISAHLTTD
jgi:hypothetical protein